MSAPALEVSARSRAQAGRLVGRYGLRSVGLLYLGLMVLLPLSAVVTKGFSGGLASLKDAFGQIGAREAPIPCQ